MYRNLKLLQWKVEHGILSQNTREAKGLCSAKIEDDKCTRKMLQKSLGLFRQELYIWRPQVIAWRETYRCVMRDRHGMQKWLLAEQAMSKCTVCTSQMHKSNVKGQTNPWRMLRNELDLWNELVSSNFRAPSPQLFGSAPKTLPSQEVANRACQLCTTDFKSGSLRKDYVNDNEKGRKNRFKGVVSWIVSKNLESKGGLFTDGKRKLMTKVSSKLLF